MTYRQLIEPSDAFTQLGQVRPGETGLDDMLQHIVRLARLSLPDVAEASVTLVQAAGAHTPASTGSLALTLDESQYELGDGPCLRAARTMTVESIGDMTTEDRWPDWTAGALRAGAGSSLSIGLPSHATVGGALNLYATQPHAFDDDAVVVAQAFAGYAGLAMATACLDDAKTALVRHVEAVIDISVVVEQAKGILMGDRGCTPAEAFAVLATMAQDTDRTVREVALAMVDRISETAG